MGELIQFPINENKDGKEIICLTEEEASRFQDLLKKAKQSISPGEATYYINELNALIEKGRQRARQ